MMKTLLSSRLFHIVLFLFLELIAVAMGMGVPFFTILLGFAVGWVIPKTLPASSELSPRFLGSLLRRALLTSSVTMLIMAVLWLPTLQWVFDSTRDLSNFGIPMILYTPLASFIGWIILMVLISPFLQFLMTLFGSILWVVISPRRLRADTSLSGDAPAA